jgi:SAM-dependent methyltransferase
MTYSKLVESAPPGAAEFEPADLARLPAGLLKARLAQVPAEERALYEAGDRAAGERMVRAFFWDLVYNLRPERWDELSQAEPIHPALLEALPADGARILEVAAGSGRLTVNLARRARTLIAIEPVAALREILASRLPEVAVLDALASDLPIPDRWADLTVACAGLGPEDAPFTELDRCTRAGGTVALISPREPEWFASRGWRWLTFKADEIVIPAHDPGLEAFFGPLDPPSQLLLRTV